MNLPLLASLVTDPFPKDLYLPLKFTHEQQARVSLKRKEMGQIMDNL